MKIEGHTHTEYCPHGPAEPAEKMILRAIELGYTDYSVTEHAPLPPAFMNSSIKDKIPTEDCAIAMSDLEHYLKSMQNLKIKYRDRIRIYVGFEIDYLEGYEDFTRDFLKEYGPQIEDSILSVHFMQGRDGMRAIDFSPGEQEWGILSYYGSYEAAEKIYFDLLIKSAQADLGPYKPKRLGHPTLFRKFRKYDFREDLKPVKEVAVPEELLIELRDREMGIEYNGSGRIKEYNGQTYPPVEVIERAKRLGLILVTGSDAHGVSEIGNTPALK